MKNVALSLSLVAASFTAQVAKADGFKCEDLNSTLKVAVYNQTSPQLGTRNSAVMIVSDQTVGYGRKTIAKFSAGTTLSHQASTYTAVVDQRYTDSRRDGELIGGTKLGQLKAIKLDVDFSYADPIEDGDIVAGKLTLLKRNGDTLTMVVDCTRYLKGE